MSGVGHIHAERLRQMDAEGWTEEHDDAHGGGELARAAACYAMPEPLYVKLDFAGGFQFSDPWPRGWRDKRKRFSNYPNAIPTDGAERIAMLVRAGALIAAEIDRLERMDAARGER